LACRGEGQPTPFLGKTSFALRIVVAILRASPKVAKNPTIVAKHSKGYNITWEYLPLGDGGTVMLPFDKEGSEVSPPVM
jgi:hypothetical protein